MKFHPSHPKAGLDFSKITSEELVREIQKMKETGEKIPLKNFGIKDTPYIKLL